MAGLFAIVFWITSALAWFTHIFHCFENDMIGMLLVGMFLPPIGSLHGVWLWFQ